MSELCPFNCQSAEGLNTQTTVVRCEGIKADTIIDKVVLQKTPARQIIYEKPSDNTSKLDPRITSSEKSTWLSLEIRNTTFSDDGEYICKLQTDCAKYTIIYTTPVTSQMDGRKADLICNATKGYPAGFIHWFDRIGTNWTENAVLTKEPKEINGVKSVVLSSKLSFKTFDPLRAPFSCVVLNSKYDEEDEVKPSAQINPSEPNKINMISAAVVIGSLIVGLLCALLIFRRKRIHYYDRGSSAGEDSECPATNERD
ncbi:hypothetical protein DNTS_034986 [Danionella cerebrum]|uniref:Ig-like domain-containing protein n=1 Tax=Danionella cerebrum TaxID=2873325 RepID=A0A553MT90_9TELE|nr:hypothetical protein DNTS_034986 [Danionella translucida]